MSLKISNPFAEHYKELQRLTRSAGSLETAERENRPGFAAVLKNSLNEVNQLQLQADDKITAVTSGRSNDTLGAIVALQRADISLQLLSQVRNKALKAYDEIIKSPV